MSAADIEARRAEAVRALEAAGGWDITVSAITNDPCSANIVEAICALDRYVDTSVEFPSAEDAADRAALHALALLLAAMTEPT